jgi:HTH-type transcriptional regulator / antitoxin HipB
MDEKQFAEKIGRLVRFHRKIARLTQLELAKLAEIGKTAVFDVERGKTTTQLSTLVRILHVLNVKITFNGPLVHLFERKENENC